MFISPINSFLCFILFLLFNFNFSVCVCVCVCVCMCVSRTPPRPSQPLPSLQDLENVSGLFLSCTCILCLLVSFKLLFSNFMKKKNNQIKSQKKIAVSLSCFYVENLESIEDQPVSLGIRCTWLLKTETHPKKTTPICLIMKAISSSSWVHGYTDKR